MSGSKKLSLLMEQSTSSRFALIEQSFSCSLCNQVNRFLRFKSCKYSLEGVQRETVIAKDSHGLIDIGWRL